MLVQKGRLSLNIPVHDYVRGVFGRRGAITATLTPAIGVAAATLPGLQQSDPVDRILVATAVEFGAHFVTRDAKIHAYARATKHVRCIRC